MSDPSPLTPEPVDPASVAERTTASVAERTTASVAERTAGELATTEAVSHPAKVMRIGAMIKQLLEEVRRAPLDEAGRSRLAEIYQTSVGELSEGLSPDLQDELRRLSVPFGDRADPPSEAELRVAQAQLVGWLEGLFHGIQATLFAQQMEARQQLEELRRRSLPAASEELRPGTYL